MLVGVTSTIASVANFRYVFTLYLRSYRRFADQAGCRIARLLVALPRSGDLLLCAKHLFVAAILAGPPASHPISQGTGHHCAAGPRQARTMLGCQDDDDLHRHPGA